MHFTIFVAYSILLMKYQPTLTAEKSYEVVIRSFEPYNIGAGVFDPKTLRVNRKGRNQFAITGDFSLLISLGEESMLVYEVLKKSDILKNYSSIMKGSANICKFTSTNTNFYPRFRTFTNFPDPQSCPFPKGNYTVKDYTIDDKLLPSIVPSGTYVVKSTFSKENQNIFGYTVEIVVT